MRWEDERYVRLYTRDTTEWLMLSWKAQGLFALVLRKCDRAGIIDLGRAGKRGLSAHIGGASSWPEIEPSLDELVSDGCIELRERGGRTLLVVPNFIEAQESNASPAARKRTQREKARDLARSVTIRDEESQNEDDESHSVSETSRAVTRSHAESRAVTPNLPNLPNQIPPVGPPKGGDTPKRGMRLPEDWQPDPDLVAWAESQGMQRAEIKRQVDSFRDYWHGAAGAKARKVDWTATFRNWIRRSLENRFPPRPPRGYDVPTEDRPECRPFVREDRRPTPEPSAQMSIAEPRSQRAPFPGHDPTPGPVSQRRALERLPRAVPWLREVGT